LHRRPYLSDVAGVGAVRTRGRRLSDARVVHQPQSPAIVPRHRVPGFRA
jgi:hypothetical protein